MFLDVVDKLEAMWLEEREREMLYIIFIFYRFIRFEDFCQRSLRVDS